MPLCMPSVVLPCVLVSLGMGDFFFFSNFYIICGQRSKNKLKEKFKIICNINISLFSVAETENLKLKNLSRQLYFNAECKSLRE